MISLALNLLQEQGPVSTSAERNLLIYMIGVLLIVCSLIVIFFVVFQKRKNKLLMDKLKQQQLFDEEISKTQIEIQDQTLKNIGQELHDNIGQLLSVANMQLSILNTEVSEDIKERFEETKNVVKESLSEVRALSKSLNSDVIANKGFHETVVNELERLNKLKLIKTKLTVKGDKKRFTNSKDSIILFRILQEFFSNTIKYAEASFLNVILDYGESNLSIRVSDNGKGFHMKTVEKGSGLINMESRADLIKSIINLSSEINKGTTLTLNYPYRKPII